MDKRNRERDVRQREQRLREQRQREQHAQLRSSHRPIKQEPTNVGRSSSSSSSSSISSCLPVSSPSSASASPTARGAGGSTPPSPDPDGALTAMLTEARASNGQLGQELSHHPLKDACLELASEEQVLELRRLCLSLHQRHEAFKGMVEHDLAAWLPSAPPHVLQGIGPTAQALHSQLSAHIAVLEDLRTVTEMAGARRWELLASDEFPVTASKFKGFLEEAVASLQGKLDCLSLSLGTGV